jgi:4-aminobutyrate aminotransferase
MPLGVTIAKEKIMDWLPGSHASTFGGNPVCIEAALATIGVIEREGMKSAEKVGRHVLERLQSWPARHPIVGDVRGMGLMIGIEVVKDQKSKAPAKDERDKIVDLAFQRGVLLLGCGENTLRFAPPLVVTEEQADVGLDILEECISLVEKQR